MAPNLKNKIVTIGDRNVQNFNVPPYYDVILQVLPACVDFEGTGYSLTYQANVVDFGTGSIQEFLLHPAMSVSGELGVASFTRAHLNKVVDFSFIVEGRYMSFWSSIMLPVFEAVINGPAVFPSMMGFDSIFGYDSSTQNYRRTFYALNWGQAQYWNDSTRILAIYTHGYARCYWTHIKECKVWTDPRLVEVTIAHDLPEILMTDIDVITEYVYMRINSDDVEFNYSTSEVATTPMSFYEDLKGAYNPWEETPPNYPKV